MEFGELLEAFQRWQRAQGALDVARESCTHDAGYFLHREFIEVEQAQVGFENALIKWADERIAEKVRSMGLVV